MSLEIVAEVWDALNSHIDLSERGEAADTLVDLLIDHNYEPDDIKTSFRGNKTVLKALTAYMEDHDAEVEDDDYDDESDDDDWN